MKISLLITDFRGGGAERVALNLVNSWVSIGFEVDLLLLQAKGQLLELLNPSVRVINLNVIKITDLPFKLFRYFRENNVSAFLVCMWPLTAIAVAARFLAGNKCKLLLAEHTTWTATKLYQRRLPRLLIRSTMRLLFPLASHVLAVSKGAANDLEYVAMLKLGSVNVMYNPVVKSGFTIHQKPENPKSWCHGDHHRILAVGTLKEIKDFTTLLNSFAQLLKDGEDARLLILGEGECRERLQKQADRLGISSRLDMPGYVDNPTPYFQHADLFVLSSKGEGLPTVIIEALANGTPVVSTDCPSGPREILVDEKFGRLVPVGDINALAEAMSVSLKSKHDIKALQNRANDFSIDNISQKYLDLMIPEWRNIKLP